MEERNTCAYNIKDIPRMLWADFKKIATLKNMTSRDIILGLIIEYVQENYNYEPGRQRKSSARKSAKSSDEIEQEPDDDFL